MYRTTRNEQPNRNKMTLPQYLILATGATIVAIMAVYSIGTTDFSKDFEPRYSLSNLENKIKEEFK